MKKKRLYHHMGRQQERQVVAYPNPKSPTRTLDTVPLSQAEDSKGNDCNYTTNEVGEGIVVPQEQHQAIRASPLSPSSSYEDSNDKDCDHHDATEVVKVAVPPQEQHPLIVASPLSPSSSEDNDCDPDYNHHDANEVDGAPPPPLPSEAVVVAVIYHYYK
mmetsp:Transcript_48265/g.54028  ORF Transcript_48265/g.54028 Transcript_48265/m.54028 type:complete len:160 (+) Transcript_48265:435-914(+)